jgi:hypothetical protein
VGSTLLIDIRKVLQSDNDSEFSNRVVNAQCRLAGIERRFIAPYNQRASSKARARGVSREANAWRTSCGRCTLSAWQQQQLRNYCSIEANHHHNAHDAAAA